MSTATPKSGTASRQPTGSVRPATSAVARGSATICSGRSGVGVPSGAMKVPARYAGASRWRSR